MKWFGKFVLSIFISFILLNLISFFYYNVPSREVDEDDVTEYKWSSNTFYSRFTEGIAWGMINNDGYNNILDYQKNMVINNLLLGSSQSEGFNVMKEENIASLLNKYTSTYTYNIGISEHTLPICISHLNNAIKKYHPTDYVILETMSISFYDDEIQNALNNNIYLDTYSSNIIQFLQNFKYLKLVYYQFGNLKHNESSRPIFSINNTVLLNEMLSYAKNLCDENNVKLIIVFHPSLTIDNDGDAIANYNRDDYKIFKDSCEKNNIILINMEDEFINNYNDTCRLPHGFINTLLGAGHLNKIGHRMIANEIMKVMGLE